MDSEKSKKILIAIAVVCLAAAAFMVLKNTKSESGPPGGVGDLSYKCTKCGATKLINRDTAIKMGRELGTSGFGPPVLDCTACGAKRTLTVAKQCPGCSTIYFPGESKDPQAPMKCPKCGKSPNSVSE